MPARTLIYCDGACSPNPGRGGWAAVLLLGTHRLELSGAEHHTTNNRMELRGAIEGLRALALPSTVTVHTDSTYVCNAFRKGWIETWRRNGWRNASKKPVENQDLWTELIARAAEHDVEWKWVKGHADDDEHNLCDRLAVAARLALV
jgi:ribonuclease HI